MLAKGRRAAARQNPKMLATPGPSARRLAVCRGAGQDLARRDGGFDNFLGGGLVLVWGIFFGSLLDCDRVSRRCFNYFSEREFSNFARFRGDRVTWLTVSGQSFPPDIKTNTECCRSYFKKAARECCGAYFAFVVGLWRLPSL